MQRVLISGITGHLGRALGANLVAAGCEVHGLTRRRIEEVAPGLPQVHLHRPDGTESMADILKRVRPDTVFHLAAMVRGEHQSADVAPMVEANILYGAQLLDAMRDSGCGRIVVAGSYLQHADTEKFRALNLYAATKQAFECLLEYYADAHEFSAVRLTVCNVYGEHEVRSSLAQDIAIACRRASTLVIRNPEARVDLVHVEDVARAFAHAATLLESVAAPKGRLSRYSVSSGTDVSAVELIRIFETVANTRLAVETSAPILASRRVKPWRGDIVPGWQPRIPIEEGITRILARTSN